MSTQPSYCKTRSAYVPAVRGKLNLYKLFICQAHALAQYGSFFSFVVPMALLGDAQSAGVRQHIWANASLRSVETFPQKDDSKRRVFREAKLATCVFVCANYNSADAFRVRTHSSPNIAVDSESHWVTWSEVSLFNGTNLTIVSCPRRDWEIVTEILSNKEMIRLGQSVKFFQGEINETNEKTKGTINTQGLGQRLVRGANVTLFAIREASQGHDLYLMVDKFLNGKSSKSKAYHHRLRRVAYQGNAPQNNFRRIIAAPVASGEFCAYTVNYCTEASSDLSLGLVLALLNSKILEWWFRLGSSNAHANEYQMNELPVPRLSTEACSVKWLAQFQLGDWTTVGEKLQIASEVPGTMPVSVAEAIGEMSRRIQDIEARRTLASRPERSTLSPESQLIQDAIDKVLFRCYGLTDDEAHYIEKRLGEML